MRRNFSSNIITAAARQDFMECLFQDGRRTGSSVTGRAGRERGRAGAGEWVGSHPAHGLAGVGEVQVQHRLRERPSQLHQVRAFSLKTYTCEVRSIRGT